MVLNRRFRHIWVPCALTLVLFMCSYIILAVVMLTYNPSSSVITDM